LGKFILAFPFPYLQFSNFQIFDNFFFAWLINQKICCFRNQKLLWKSKSMRNVLGGDEKNVNFPGELGVDFYG
jgi:hypothetical protein